ncbi:MAG TPA: DUF2934 domain-containing protein [Tepidisphaeraceae bacterium]|nr:DUF2934 domain-containing protein [Tepidisphaeraceae bacterium]
MAKKSSTPKTTATPAKKVTATPASTAVRNSPVPKVAKAVASTAPVAAAAAVATPAAKVVTHDDIAARAYELFRQGVPGSEADHWHQAERELRGL